MIVLLTILIVILDAGVNWFIIEKLKHTVNHMAQVGIYCLMLSPLLFWFGWQEIAIYGTVSRLAFYDPLLNKMRGFPILYNGKATPEPGRKQSFTDWLENKTGIPVIYFRIGYLVAFIITLFIV